MLISTHDGVDSSVTTRTRYAYGSVTATGTPRTCELVVRSGSGVDSMPADITDVRAGRVGPTAWATAPRFTSEHTVTRFITGRAAQRELTSLQSAGFNAQRDSRSPADYKRRNGPGAYYTGPDVLRLITRTNRVFVAWRRQGVTWWDDVTVIDHGDHYDHCAGVREIGHSEDYCARVRSLADDVVGEAATVTRDTDGRATGVRLYGRDFAVIVTCNDCGRRWDDAHPSPWTPTPAGRCPFEHDHGEPIARWY
ncbi:hypothetical protein O4158_21180 [Gordonia amicalis]|uniref:hypothetical protein n=1 Tax=Gordonia amicalis TaxID=89053 RepID=UPI0022B35291|nr:hypothetical protein [Gordonia amicalis]MCZ4581554.1 hypothetical protein [Gordonia amicalis]